MDSIVFVGDWVKDRVLGSGSFGVVVLWKHKRTEERLAIKTCKWGDELTAKHRERWTKEVEMMQNCDNPNIVGTKDLPKEFLKGLEKANPSGLPILCMEYCSGGDLRQLLNRPESCAGLKETQVRHILSDIGNALQFLHSYKITHRDLKPENIVLSFDDSVSLASGPINDQTKVTYKLIDLGYAKEIDSNSICASFVGTLQYLAPEIIYSKSYSNSVDYWSFGLLAFEILCGVRPFLPFMAPVQWMPYVKKKSHETICMYEPFHEGDSIQYSNEIFLETNVSKTFKTMIEKWLQVALEYDPKLRGRNSTSKVTFANSPEQSSNNIVIFSLLEKILSTKILKLFSVYTMSYHSYEINDSTTIATLKSWISKDLNIAMSEQMIVSQKSYSDLNNEDLVMQYWTENSSHMLYVYNKRQIVNDIIQHIVPKSVQRVLEKPKDLYNYKNSQNLYRHGLHFVLSQREIYDELISGLFTLAESFKHESRQLLLKNNDTDKRIGKLVTQAETVNKFINMGRKHVEHLKESGTATNYLGGFQKIFEDAEGLDDKITKLQTACSQWTVRLQSAARRSNELTSEIKNFLSKYNYVNLYTNAVKTYITFKRSELHTDFKTKSRQCHDIMKVCYECLKFSRNDIIPKMQSQPFVLTLRDLGIELSKISDIISKAADNISKLDIDLSLVTDELTHCIWSTLTILATDADNLADLPYSVVSYQKRDFKVGESVSNHCIKVKNNTQDDELKSLVEESLKLRQNQINLYQKINSQKSLITKSDFDFSFLNDNN